MGAFVFSDITVFCLVFGVPGLSDYKWTALGVKMPPDACPEGPVVFKHADKQQQA